SHFTKAVSELGVWGAPNMWWFNVFGYIIPGMLLAACGWMIARTESPGSRILAGTLALSGLCITLAGLFPADMDAMSSPTSLLHITGSVGGGLLWAIAMVWLAFLGRKTCPALSLLCLGALLLMLGAFFLYGYLLPGLVQRITFAVLFAWYIAAAAILTRSRAP
ncbi:MAG: DUF998 domain-containing protein, partial [Pseudomonadota bacterium]